MAQIRRKHDQKVTKSARARQFEIGLIDQIRFDQGMQMLWNKYRFDITLPNTDSEKVQFKGSDNDFDFKRLKDFILNFEENWMTK